MDHFEIISLHVHQYLDRYMLTIRWRGVEQLSKEAMGHERCYDLQPGADSLMALLMAVSEEVFNQADEIAGAAARAAAPATTSGGLHSVDEWPNR